MLEQLHLPLAGVDEHLPTMLVAREGEHIVGTAGLELYADGALLRSVAVEPHRQGKRLGHQLTDAALHLATSNGANAVFLLTTTAERFFPKFGFEPIDREQVPRVRSSVGRVSIGVSGVGDRHAEAAPMTVDVPRRLAAEAIGTAMLLAAVVGSGIMADRLSGGNDAIALLANTIATAAALTALILTFGPISGAHFTPAVSIADASQGGLSALRC